MSQLCQTGKLQYICYACFPVFEHPCKLLTAKLRICDVKICTVRYCMSQDTWQACLRLADLLPYRLFSSAALLPVVSYLHQAAVAIQEVPTQLLRSTPLQDEASAVQARLPWYHRCGYTLAETPLLAEQSNADKLHCAETAVLLSLSGLCMWCTQDTRSVSLLASRLIQTHKDLS